MAFGMARPASPTFLEWEVDIRKALLDHLSFRHPRCSPFHCAEPRPSSVYIDNGFIRSLRPPSLPSALPDLVLSRHKFHDGALAVPPRSLSLPGIRSDGALYPMKPPTPTRRMLLKLSVEPFKVGTLHM